MNSNKLHRLVLIWLVVGLILVYLQIVIGGITRLTESGLSITKWEVVTGVVPPLNAADWMHEFELYKDTPQYAKLNQGMTLDQFKWIYFWEYLHRLWARMMGLVFLFGFLLFFRYGMLPPGLIRRLLVTVALAGLAGIFGWIMVASGLIERPWVNAYKLTIHLGIALLVFGHHLVTIVRFGSSAFGVSSGLRTAFRCFLFLLCIQIFFGGLMSGMKASLVFPTFPDFHGSMIPEVLMQGENWNVDNVVNYDQSAFMAGLVQVLHRFTAYALVFNLIYIIYRFNPELFGRTMLRLSTLWIILLVCQIGLGIAVLMGSYGSVPLGYGVFHQGVAILLLGVTLALYFRMQVRKDW